MPRKTFTEEQVVNLLRKACETAGGQMAFARKTGIDGGNLSSTLTGRLKPGGEIIAALGLRRIVIETYIAEAEDFTPPRGYVEVTGRAGRVKGYRAPEKAAEKAA